MYFRNEVRILPVIASSILLVSRRATGRPAAPDTSSKLYCLGNAEIFVCLLQNICFVEDLEFGVVGRMDFDPKLMTVR